MTSLENAKQLLPLPDLFNKLGLSDHAKKSARCPFHDDSSNSFSVYRNDKGEWRWKCHAGCGQGDASDLVAKIENLSSSAACSRYIELAGARGCSDRLTHSVVMSGPSFHVERSSCSRTRDLPYSLSNKEVNEAIEMIAALKARPDLCERIAKARGWKPETIRDLASETSLGWHDGKLAFIYESGVKLRWREENERVIRWAFGKPWLWRGSFLFDNPGIVYLVEGETDAISLIDAGVENESRALVVALPSASTFDSSWANLFSGREVILAFDADEAGFRATERVSKVLRPHVQTLKQLNWEGVRYASAS